MTAPVQSPQATERDRWLAENAEAICRVLDYHTVGPAIVLRTEGNLERAQARVDAIREIVTRFKAMVAAPHSPGQGVEELRGLVEAAFIEGHDEYAKQADRFWRDDQYVIPSADELWVKSKARTALQGGGSGE